MPPLPSDNEKKAFRGKRLQIPAAAWNKIIDATKAYTRSKGREGPAGEDTDTLLPATTILVQNTLSTDLAESFHVLRVGDPNLTADASPVNLAERLTLTGTYPAAGQPFAVLQEPCAENEFAKAAVSGYTLCYVLMNDPGDEWADAIDTTDTHLGSQTDPGPARIIWHGAGGTPPVTGAELAVVHLVGAGAGAAGGVTSWKDVVRVATTTNGALSTAFAAGQVVDGATLATGDRILIKDQTTAAENWIYTVNSSGAPTRVSDNMLGAVVFVSEGTANRNTVWGCVTDAAITPGTTSTVWVQFTPEVCVVTVTDTGGGHTVKKQTVGGDVAGPVTFHPCYSATGSALPVGTRVYMSRVPDVQTAANYWIFPVGSTLTVEEDDGSPSYTDIGTLQFDHNAFVVTQPSAGKALISTNFTVEEDDGSPSYTGIYDLQFDHIFHTVTQPSAGKALVTFAMPHGEGSGYDSYIVSGADALTWTNVMLVSGSSTPLVLPGHGWYDLELTFNARFDMADPGAGGAADLGVIDVRWRNDTDAVDYADDFAARSRLTTGMLPVPGDTLWIKRVTIPTRVHVTEGTDASKNFIVQASVACTAGGTCRIEDLRVYYRQLSA